MTVRMLVNATAPNELRIAVVEDGELVELDVEAAEKSTLRGNIYKGVIHNVEGSLEAAFVDIGSHKQGFLPFSEVSEASFDRPSKSQDPKINEVLKRGQEIVVQVSKDAVGEKGATLTTFLSIPGRYTVLMPGSDTNGAISRKIEDDKTRKRIKAMSQKLVKPEDCGFIIRTAGLNQTRVAIQRDLDKVASQWEKLQKSAKIARAPSILHAEPDLVARTLRDFFTDEIDEVLIDTKEEYEAAVQYFAEVMPDYNERLLHYQNPIPIFAYHRIEEQIESTFERRVGLPSGGSIVIDETEALVAVDVNSGKMTSEGDHEGTVFKTNVEAAEEVARQLRLRDLGGIVVVDFIDMEMTKHKREVEKTLAEAATDDKARWKISRINSKGLCVFTRQRIRQGMRKAYQHRCGVCDGTGWMRTAESHSLSLMRRIETRLAQGGVGEVRIKTHRETAEYLNNQRRSELLALERQYHCRVMVVARPDIDRGSDEVVFMSHGELLAEITDRLPPRERRKERGGKRRRKRKKRDDSSMESSDDKEPRTRKKRTPRKRRSETEEAPIAAKGDTTFTGKPSPEMLAKLKAEREERKRRRAEEKAAGTNGEAAADKPTKSKAKTSKKTSNRPAKAKAGADETPTEPPKPRRKRSTRPKKADAADGTSVGFAGTVEKGEAHIRKNEGTAEDAEKRKSLLDRIFGGR